MYLRQDETSSLHGLVVHLSFYLSYCTDNCSLVVPVVNRDESG